jgi:hypothetical protein
MGMNDSERFALAARLATALKRNSGRVIDVLWLLQDEHYVREVLRLARAADPECTDLAFRYEQLLRDKPRSAVPTPAPVASSAAASAPAPAVSLTSTGAFTATGSHYVRGLR